MIEKTRSRAKHKIEKHMLALGEPERIEDLAFRKSFKDRVCEASDNGEHICGKPCVGAHIRADEVAGGGHKPSDCYIVGLCNDHHADQESNPGTWWWMKYVFKPMLKRRYREWKNDKK